MAKIEKNLDAIKKIHTHKKKVFLVRVRLSLSLLFIGINKRNVSTMGLTHFTWDGCQFSHYFVSKQYFEMPVFSVTLANF